ncbi:hypothetical protein PHYPSEUDO_014224 [Phytophthora pseudosyringae]|uniref:Uncharacterized protein n=1 Tax=Phytophthora pseudosyringae TaxID=221518 RepID=A0A8T1WFZ2_9STRA|nr:hypothetical protein PHYPSEUDO_014224 [Phytophthora pseudosyringae]
MEAYSPLARAQTVGRERGGFDVGVGVNHVGFGQGIRDNTDDGHGVEEVDESGGCEVEDDKRANAERLGSVFCDCGIRSIITLYSEDETKTLARAGLSTASERARYKVTSALHDESHQS